MDKPITKVLKSKSSNSAITMKINKRKNKTTKSNMDFQTSAIKKRGVYVENKDENLDINVQVAAQSNKLPKLPRPDKKCFLTSVLTMLSKSTVGTQHPDVDYAKEIKTIGTRRNIKKTIYNRSETTKDRMSEKKKYKSKILNHKKDDKLVILQSTKEIINTPSIDSELSHAGVNNAMKSNYLENYLRQSVTSAERLLAREVLEGEQHRKAKIRFNNDPPTLVSDVNHRDDKGLYNFFVDLLETTLSVCNLKAEGNDVTADVSNPKLDLEIRASVAEKLNIIDKYKLIEEESQKPLGQVHRIQNDQINWDDTELGKEFQGHPHNAFTFKEAPLNVQAKRRLKSSSFDYSKERRTKSKRKINKASRKKSLLNSLKEQLRMASETYVEPKNIFVALKQIAENKRRYEKSIKFHQQYKDGGNACRFKRRKVISTSNGSKRREKFNPKREILRSPLVISPSMDSRNENAVTTDFDSESHHSLEVYGFDDITNTYKRQEYEEKISLTYHSSVSISDSNIDSNEITLNYTFNGANIIN